MPNPSPFYYEQKESEMDQRIYLTQIQLHTPFFNEHDHLTIIVIHHNKEHMPIQAYIAARIYHWQSKHPHISLLKRESFHDATNILNKSMEIWENVSNNETTIFYTYLNPQHPDYTEPNDDF